MVLAENTDARVVVEPRQAALLRLAISRNGKLKRSCYAA